MRVLAAAILLLSTTLFAPAQAALKCKTIVLGAGNESAVLEGIPVWEIKNAGPASVIIQTQEGRASGEIASGENTVFLGDAAYTYSIGLAAPGTKAKVQVCE